MNGNELIASILKQEGVELMTCFPNNPLIETAAEQKIRPVAFRHERGAIMAADGFSRTSDRLKFGVVALQSQAGAENAMGGIAQAYADNIPILVLPGGVLLNQIAVKPNFTAVQNYQGITKQVEAIYRPEDIASTMRRAFHALKNGPAGPVVVELTADVCAQEIPENARRYDSPCRILSQPSDGDIGDAVKALLAMAISACRRRDKYIGICGQGPSDHPDLAQWLMEQGIESMSLNPDTVVDTWLLLAGVV